MADNPIPQTPPTQVVGPNYRAPNQKPSATVSKEVPFDNVHVLPQTPQLIALLSCVTRPASLFYGRLSPIQDDSQQDY